MTREEIIQAISDDKMMPFTQPDQLAEIVDFVIKNYKPSLPSDLDEAAEEFAYNNWEDNDYHTGASEGLPFDAIGHTEKCFRAGVEWLAGQGVTKEVVIGMATEEISITVSQQTLDDLDLCPGDKIIVQIRKKIKK